MKKFILILGVLVLLGCFMPKGDNAVSPEARDDGSGRNVSSVISSFFEPSAEEKAQTDKIRDRQKLLERQNQQMQKDRLKSYQFPDAGLETK